MGKYAHFEQKSELEHLYIRHAEVARDIHQDVLRQLTGDQNITVDLVPMSPLNADQAVLDKMSEYDVVSVSTLASAHNGISRADNAMNVKQHFAQNDMPIYVVSSGNDGRQERLGLAPRVADFSRTSLVVSEANFDDKGAFVEDHSNWRKVTLASDNPFNRGESYQLVDLAPSLEGHEDLIRKWLVDREGLEGDDLEAKLTHYMDNPEALHTIVLSDLRERYDFDERGYRSGVNGTSFSSPETAAYMSKAHWDQEQREERNLPVLSKEEISTLARLATVDTSRGGDDRLLHTYNNHAEFQLTGAGGHGVLHPEMFNTLLQRAYETLETTPDIDRDTVDVMFSPNRRIRNDGKEAVLSADLDEGQSIVIERMRVDFSMTGTNPGFVFYGVADRDVVPTSSEIASNASRDTHKQGWSRIESRFGEVLNDGDDLRFRAPNSHRTTIHDASITVYGYNEGGFMHQMMKHSQEIMPQFMQDPDVAEPTEPVVETPPQDDLSSGVSSLPRAR
ncbi:MAG: hypothetical protein ACRBDL_11170 [Alphaproteobacteria bacterium]